jgi:YHS domain-containing protein
MLTRTLSLVLTVLLGGALAACGGADAPATHDHDDHEGHDHGAAVPGAKGDYPLDTCVVSGEPLGSMGAPYVVTHDGTEVLLCCEGCVEEFEQSPDKYVKAVRAAAKR